jgi:N-acetylneuraminate lyase
MPSNLVGLIAATYTPLHRDGSLNLDPIPGMVDYLLESGVSGLYVCGSTGEGVSLTSDERRAVAEAFTKAANKRVPVVVQVGHNSVAEARELASHAQQIGADVISATCPSYFKVGNIAALIDCMSAVADGAPDLPFYYYHIPILTGSTIDMTGFLSHAREQIPNLHGLKYTAPLLHEYQACLRLDNGHFDVVWGTDEMLLGALATGAKGAIGSTYNIMAPLYRQIMDAFTAGDLDLARDQQARAWQIIKTIAQFPFHSAMKEVLTMQGHAMGRCRTPQQSLTSDQVAALRRDLDALSFFDN